jgi:hypothetical protein
MTDPVRIAMWSGPRNMSTTMMRSFGARQDTVCVDEPFYGAYLKLTGLRHPMTDEIFSAHDFDPESVARKMALSPPAVPVFYQKHMTHHMVEGIPRGFMRDVRNVFLIRHPARVLASYARKMETVSLEATGFPQQLELFEQATALEGAPPPVVDSDDILRDPKTVLSQLCDQLNIPWDDAMLFWPAGERAEDGAWAPHWYDKVWASTGFGPAPGAVPSLEGELADLCAEAMPIYNTLSAHKIF